MQYFCGFIYGILPLITDCGNISIKQYSTDRLGEAHRLSPSEHVDFFFFQRKKRFFLKTNGLHSNNLGFCLFVCLFLFVCVFVCLLFLRLFHSCHSVCTLYLDRSSKAIGLQVKNLPFWRNQCYYLGEILFLWIYTFIHLTFSFISADENNMEVLRDSVV